MSVPNLDVMTYGDGGKTIVDNGTLISSGPGYPTNSFEISVLGLKKVTFDGIDVTSEYMKLKVLHSDQYKEYDISTNVKKGIIPKINGIDISYLMIDFDSKRISKKSLPLVDVYVYSHTLRAEMGHINQSNSFILQIPALSDVFINNLNVTDAYNKLKEQNITKYIITSDISVCNFSLSAPTINGIDVSSLLETFV